MVPLLKNFSHHFHPGGVVSYLYCIHLAGAGSWIGRGSRCGAAQCRPQSSVVSIWSTLYFFFTCNFETCLILLKCANLCHAGSKDLGMAMLVVGPPLWSRLKNWMDCNSILYRHSWFTDTIC